MTEENKPKTFFGFPVVYVNEVPKGKVVLARLPTLEEILAAGYTSLSEWIEHHPTELGVIENIDTE